MSLDLRTAVPGTFGWAVLRRLVWATRAMFLLCGVVAASWAPLVPYAQTRLSLNNGQLGLLLLAPGCGSLLAMPLSGHLISRFGSRRILLWAFVLTIPCLPMLALAGATWLLALALAVFGAALGTVAVGINDQAAEVERISARPWMSSFHAFFSGGALLGAGSISWLLGRHLPLWGCSAMVMGTIVLLLPLLRFGPGARPSAGAGAAGFVLPRGVVLVLGVMCFVAFMAEGATLDWSAVFMRTSRGMPMAHAGYAYAGFSVTMALGRWFGDRLVDRFGAQKVLVCGGLLGAAGLCLAATINSIALSLLGFVMLGAALANMVPILLSSASRTHGMSPSQAIAATSTLGYAGLLVGPAMIGSFAHYTSLPVALAGVALLLLLMAANGLLMGRWIRSDSGQAEGMG
ncbi:MFS transporter [Frateuria aurantia]